MSHATNAKMRATNDVTKDRSERKENMGYGYIFSCRDHITGMRERAAISVINAAKMEVVRRYVPHMTTRRIVLTNGEEYVESGQDRD